jgi:hypothetical protein
MYDSVSIAASYFVGNIKLSQNISKSWVKKSVNMWLNTIPLESLCIRTCRLKCASVNHSYTLEFSKFPIKGNFTN